MKAIVHQEEHINPYEKAVQEHQPSPGDIYCSKSTYSARIFRLISKEESKYGVRWKIETLSGWEGEAISEADLKASYRPILNDYDKVHSFAEKVVEGKAEEVMKELLGGGENSIDSVETEALMVSESPQKILAVLDESERLSGLLGEIHHVAENLIKIKQEELWEQGRRMSKVVEAMQAKINNLLRIITILNLYTGTTVDVEQLMDGEPADASEMLHLRQRVLYMDEELCVHLDHEGDYKDIGEFKRWVCNPVNRDIIVPEKKCIVALKPKRFDKEYRSGDPVYDAERNVWNKHTYIIIRNGERLYMLDSEDLECWDWAFPHEDFEEKFYEEMKAPGSFKDHSEAKHRNERYRVTKYMAFLQGLIDGEQQILGPMAYHPNLMKAEGVVLVRDDESLLGTGRKPWRAFCEEKNKLIHRGTRILYVCKGPYWEGPRSRKHYCSGEFVKYYTYEFSEPKPPRTGVYHADTIDLVDHYEQHKPVMKTAPYFIFRYLPGDKLWSRDCWGEEHDRKKRVAWKFYDDSVLNYDAVTVEELRGYLEDRSLRSEFREMMPILKKMLLEKIEEQKNEEAFKTLMASTILKECGKAISDEEMNEAISWWKMRVIYSRPIKSDDAKAFRMIKSRLMKCGH